MSNIILAELLSVIDNYDKVRIYMQGYKYITTASPKDILEGSDFIFLIDSNIRVTYVEISYDYDYGEVLEIVVKEIKNESE